VNYLVGRLTIGIMGLLEGRLQLLQLLLGEDCSVSSFPLWWRAVVQGDVTVNLRGLQHLSGVHVVGVEVWICHCWVEKREESLLIEMLN
jgi:hypothetical protein